MWLLENLNELSEKRKQKRTNGSLHPRGVSSLPARTKRKEQKARGERALPERSWLLKDLAMPQP